MPRGRAVASRRTDSFCHFVSKKTRQEDSLQFSPDLLSPEGPVFMDLSESEPDVHMCADCVHHHRQEVKSTD